MVIAAISVTGHENIVLTKVLTAEILEHSSITTTKSADKQEARVQSDHLNQHQIESAHSVSNNL